jgi:hypothetical protein
MSSPDPVVCVLRHEGQPIHRTDWGGALYLCNGEWHVYLPEDGGDPTMHAVLDDAVKRLTEAAFAAGRESALNREEWRTCIRHRLYMTHPEIWGKAFDQAEVTSDLTEARKHYPDAWVERRRVGCSDWERVSDGDL